MSPGARGPAAFADLSARQGCVLRAVLEEYVETARPVASKRAVARSGLDLSPATVRGVFGSLDELGLLIKPHSSAGRVPTDRAFRLLVDQLLGDDVEAPARDAATQGEGAPRSEGAQTARDLLRRATSELSQGTGQLAFFVNLEAADFRLSRVHFVRVSAEQVMALLVSGSGTIHNRLVREVQASQRELDRMSARLSEMVGGLSLREAREKLEAAIARDRASRDAALLVLGEASLAPVRDADFYVGDRQPLLAQPEFADGARLREVLSALEEKERMLALLDQALVAKGLCVRIGEELDAPEMHSCAVVTALVGDEASGTGVGIIGPVRMRYDVVIPAVRAVSERIRDTFAG